MSTIRFSQLTLVSLLLFDLTFPSPGHAGGEGRQWQPAQWPTARAVSLFDLVEQGYEVRAYQPGLERNWLYLQKERRLYRCHSPEQDAGATICQELVDPE
jgi:hypothetical protein